MELDKLMKWWLRRAGESHTNLCSLAKVTSTEGLGGNQVPTLMNSSCGQTLVRQLLIPVANPHWERLDFSASM